MEYVPMYELLKRQCAFAPEEVETLANVFEDALNTLGLVDRQDPMTAAVAKKLVDLARAGVREPARLKSLTVQAFREPFRPSDV